MRQKRRKGKKPLEKKGENLKMERRKEKENKQGRRGRGKRRVREGGRKS